ncbi:NMDA receptor-regulated protein 1-domain-containing protein [Lipomyces arxii]|uniref:NMDA receptor-regulated protein 1-domain-containing protein n=1 Tax=Lipomyces arxii TaxID=56418 RepID=UPI0034CD402A
MATIPKARQLPTKEAASFRQILKLYETRQYKKAIKLADGILQKFPEHGETLAMKGLILSFSGEVDKKDEAADLIKRGLRNDISSFICWHVFGLYHRSERNFEEALKAYTQALKFDPENSNILRDLSFLQAQMRHWDGLVTSRKAILANRPNIRQNWTALAMAYHMVKRYDLAENILTKYEDTVKDLPVSKDDAVENSELLMYKNVIIYESGNIAHALEHLDEITPKVLDKLAVSEYRAKYLYELGRLAEAVVAYRKLVHRNPDCKKYLQALEQALGILDKPSERKVLYEELAKKYKRSDVIRAIPLSFLEGDEFEEAIKSYVVGQLVRGTPATFVNVKPLYVNPEKVEVIEKAVLEYYNSSVASNGYTNGTHTGAAPTIKLWTMYFLAQHYSKLQQYDLALEYINKVVVHTPTLVEGHMMKAKIVKHTGDLVAASDSMTAARELDLQDRFINTKAVKYLMRANKVDEAIAVASLFTKNDEHGKGVNDLHEMQAMWFLTEQGEMFTRMGKTGLALKRFHYVKKIYDDWVMEQFDFHGYCIKRGTMRVYADMIHWSDEMYKQPYYVRAAVDAIKVYLDMYDNPRVTKIANEYEYMSEEERKKAIKKAKRERAKENKKASSTEKIAGDDDPLGRNLENTKKPLDDAWKFWKPIDGYADIDPSWTWGVEIKRRQDEAAAKPETPV